jgi:hypothetical protein
VKGAKVQEDMIEIKVNEEIGQIEKPMIYEDFRSIKLLYVFI